MHKEQFTIINKLDNISLQKEEKKEEKDPPPKKKKKILKGHTRKITAFLFAQGHKCLFAY